VIYTSVAGNDTVRLFTQMAEFGLNRNVQVVGASGTVTSQNLPAIGKAAEGFVTGVGYTTGIDSAGEQEVRRRLRSRQQGCARPVRCRQLWRAVLLQGRGGEGQEHRDRQGARLPCAAWSGAPRRGMKTMRAGDHQAMQDMYAMRVNNGKFEIVGRSADCRHRAGHLHPLLKRPDGHEQPWNGCSSCWRHR
jgi:branched-chain amino acid transport system substrate-binding protein